MEVLSRMEGINVANSAGHHFSTASAPSELSEDLSELLQLDKRSCGPEERQRWEDFVGIPHDTVRDEDVLMILSLIRLREAFVISDMTTENQGLVYVSPRFEEMTGYDKSEILGYNCRFLQGQDTDPKDVRFIHEAIVARRKCNVKLLNYRKDCQPFDNHFVLVPVWDMQDSCRYYVGVQCLSEQSQQKVMNVCIG